MAGAILTLIGGTSLLWLIMPIIHEVGHAVAGWAVGLEHVRIHWQWPSPKTTCNFSESKPRNFLFSLGGVLAQGIILVSAISALHVPVATSLATSYGAIIAINVLPLWPADGYYLRTEVFTESTSVKWVLWMIYGAAITLALTVSIWTLSTKSLNGFSFWWICSVTIIAVGMSLRRSFLIRSYKGDMLNVDR